jgi:hypothetical protein
MRRTWTFFLLTVLAVPFAAQAQAPAPKEREAAQFNEVERGFHFGLTAGPFFLMNPPTTAGRPSPFSTGQELRLELGMDFGPYVSFAIFGMLTANRAPAQYIGLSEGAASGDFASVTPGGVLRISFLGIRDGQDVKRVWIYLRAGAGYTFFYPRPLLPNNDVLIFAGPGVEYFTRLRHFSIGLEVTGTFLALSGTFGFAVTPTLRYAF